MEMIAFRIDLKSEENKVDEDADVDYNVVAVNCKDDFELEPNFVKARVYI